MRNAKLTVVFFTMIVFFCLVEFFYMIFFAREFYHEEFNMFISREVNWPVTILHHLIYTTGIMIFAVRPSLKENSLTKVLGIGSFLGFFAYANYDLSNLATIQGWPLSIVTVDLAWGTLITGATAAIGFIMVEKLALPFKS